MRRAFLLVLLVSLACSCPPAAAAPEEKDEAKASPLRFFQVGALTMGRHPFIPRVLGLTTSPNDETYPLFGAEGEEPWLPVGTVDELVEAVRSQVGTAAWDVEGSAIRAMGNRTLLVRQEAAALDAVGAALWRMEQRWNRPVHVEVVAVRTPADLEAQPTAERLAALAGGDQVVAAGSLVMLPEQRVTSFAGREIAYLRDYDVQIATKASINDPVVGVLNAGLGLDVHATPHASGAKVRLRLAAHLVEPLRIDTASAGEDRELEQPVLVSTRAFATADLAVGAWTLLEGSAPRGESRHVVFLVRARLGDRLVREPGRGASVPVFQDSGAGPSVERSFDIGHLLDLNPDRMGRSLNVWPSYYTPPEPLELAEPTGAIYSDTLVELVRTAVSPEAWGSRGGELLLGRDTLWVRAPAPTVDAVNGVLTAVDRALVWGAEIEARLVEVPAAAADGLLGPLAPEALATLEKMLAGGGGTVLERVRTRSTGAQRNALEAVSERPYVMDYSPLIADEAAKSNPDVGHLASGIVLDVYPELTSTRDAVVTTVRLTRSIEEQAPRPVRTTAGEIRCPDMRVHELRADVELPFGRTVAAATWASGAARRTVLLLSARATGAGR